MSAAALGAGAFVGLIGAVAIYHLLLFAVLGALELLSYAAYLFALLAFELARPPFSASLAHPLQQWLFWWSFALLCVLGYWFFRSFLLLATQQPRLNRTFLWLCVATALAALPAPWLPPAYHVALELPALAVLGVAAAALAGAWRRGVRVASFFGIAYGGFVAGTLARLAYDHVPAALGWAAPACAWGIEIGAGFQALTLALGLADRIAAANEERDRAQRRTIEEIGSLNVAFARFVPRAFLDLLGIADVRDVRLGDGIERELTVLFCDVRGFTTIAERLPPREIFALLNELLSRIGPIVREHGGHVDKYVGDAIMALFPGPAGDALRAAIALQAAVDALNGERVARGEAPIALGAGIHRGTVMLGTIGEAERMDGTVIADAVNVAARVEGLTKFYGVRVLTTDAVVAALTEPAAFDLRFLGRVAVKGKHTGIGVYEALAAETPQRRAATASLRPRFDAAVEAFVAGRFADAAAAFEDVSTQDPADGPARYLLERALDLGARAQPWAGVDLAAEK